MCNKLCDEEGEKSGKGKTDRDLQRVDADPSTRLRRCRPRPQDVEGVEVEAQVADVAAALLDRVGHWVAIQ